MKSLCCINPTMNSESESKSLVLLQCAVLCSIKYGVKVFLAVHCSEESNSNMSFDDIIGIDKLSKWKNANAKANEQPGVRALVNALHTHWHKEQEKLEKELDVANSDDDDFIDRGKPKRDDGM